MGKNVNVTPDHEINSRISKTLPTTEYGPKKTTGGQTRSNSDCRKFMALQEALQDPITVYEGS